MIIDNIIEHIREFIKPSIMKKYLNEMHKQYNYFATWPVYEHLKLGDVGILQNNQFTRLTNLKNLDISYTEIVDTGYKADLIYTSDAGVKRFGNYGVDVAPLGIPIQALNADISIYFEKSNSIFFSVPDISISHIDNKNSLGSKILERYNNNNKYEDEKKWNLNWVVITDLQYAKTATFLLSNGDKSYIALKAQTGVPIELITSLKCSLTTQSCQNVAMQVFAKDGVTPLFKGIKLGKISWDIFARDLTLDLDIPVASISMDYKGPSEVHKEWAVRNMVDKYLSKVILKEYLSEVMIDRDSLIKETIDKYLSEGTIDEYLSEVMIDNYLSETMKDKGLLIEPGSIVTPMDIKFQDFDLESSE